jgi:hypothetical protein
MYEYGTLKLVDFKKENGVGRTIVEGMSQPWHNICIYRNVTMKSTV